MSKLHDALHQARRAVRQLDLDGLIVEANVSRARGAITDAMREITGYLNSMLDSARSDLEQALDPNIDRADARRLARDAEGKVATVLGHLHITERCDRVAG